MRGLIYMLGLGYNDIINWMTDNKILSIAAAAATFAVYLGLHFWVRKRTTATIMKRIPVQIGPGDPDLRLAFKRTTRFDRSIFQRSPAGWGKRAIKRLEAIILSANQQIEHLNDRYADPAGKNQEMASLGVTPDETA